jgi:beta-lactamase regulating signal transducer with metallopeptidase domain
VWPSFDHCMVHPGEHLHLCPTHLPEQVGNLGSRVCLVAAGVFIVLHTGRGLVMLHNAVRSSSRLVAQAVPVPHLGARVVRTTQPLCLLVGVLRSTVLISEGLLQKLTAEQLDAVLLHEQAHARRRDTLLRLVAHATTLLLWRPTRRRLLFELELAAEQSCDEAAACAIGDRLVVADTIIKVERLLQHTPPALSALAVSFGGTTVPQRVTALLEPQRTESRRFPILGVVSMGLVLVFTSSAPIHHATETLLAVLTR